MRAAVFDRYGGPEVVRIAEIPRPEPRAREVLVRVDASAVTSADSRIRAARFPPGFSAFARMMFGVTRPRRPILGSTFSGTVESVGARVTDLAPGDEVCGMTGMRLGAHAEYVTAKNVTRKPPGATHDDAAGVLFGGTTATSERFDVVLDTVGTLSIASGRQLLCPDGRLLLVVASLGDTIRARGNVVAGSAPERAADFDLLLRLVADGVVTVVHDQTYGLDDIVEAHRRVDSGHKVGNVVVRPSSWGRS